MPQVLRIYSFNVLGLYVKQENKLMQFVSCLSNRPTFVRRDNEKSKVGLQTQLSVVYHTR